jgi:hypothetical protein
MLDYDKTNQSKYNEIGVQKNNLELEYSPTIIPEKSLIIVPPLHMLPSEGEEENTTLTSETIFPIGSELYFPIIPPLPFQSQGELNLQIPIQESSSMSISESKYLNYFYKPNVTYDYLEIPLSNIEEFFLAEKNTQPSLLYDYLPPLDLSEIFGIFITYYRVKTSLFYLVDYFINLLYIKIYQIKE